MGQKSFIGVAAFLVVLIGGAIALYVYDAGRDDQIAEGITVAGVDVGGMHADEARKVIAAKVATEVARPIVVRFRKRRYHLSANDARLRADVDGMVEEAIARSRDGNLITRSARDLMGRKEVADVPAKVGYSAVAVDRLVTRVKKGSDQPARDARVGFDGSGPVKVDERDGVEIGGAQLRRRIRDEIATIDRDRVVRASARITKPKVTRRQLASKYPKLIVLNRGAFRLSYYENLKLVRNYTVAVGQAGLETPAGEYNIQNKAVNAPWSVPDKAWAGPLAGKVIPGGAPDNPLKARWLGVADGAGIHGTDDTGSLGTAGSHGCIRMAIPEVIELYDRVPVGTPIFIS
ncbi:MAG: L,D-transpeptidase family protein [Thermoleophilaceae bacterium]